MASSLPLDIPPNQQIKPQLLAGHSVLQCQGPSPRHNRTRQCVGSCRVCIMLPVRVTTSDLCGQTPEIISVIRGLQVIQYCCRGLCNKGFSQNKFKYDPTYITAYNTVHRYITTIFIIQSNPEVWMELFLIIQFDLYCTFFICHY